jgi:trans-2,3-dihydro-3-hydroxyanthranilate isomerase
MKRYPYYVVDVFTKRQFGGNPLAVITDARGLSSDQMQQIAIEFNFSETSFVLPPSNSNHSAQVRIFTTSNEVGFAGHPNVGTAFVLAQESSLFGKPIGDSLIFEELAGLVEVKLDRRAGRVEQSTISAPRSLYFGPEPALEQIAACVSLPPQAILSSSHPPVSASVGLAFVIAQVADRTTLAEAKANLAQFSEADRRFAWDDQPLAIFLYCTSPDQPEQISARMFAFGPPNTVTEDPATGSASAAMTALQASLLPDSDAELRVIIEQGVDMGRPSTIEVVAFKEAGEVKRVEVSGSSVLVMRGELLINEE